MFKLKHLKQRITSITHTELKIVNTYHLSHDRQLQLIYLFTLSLRKLRPSLFCNVTQWRLIVSYRSFGTTQPSRLQGSSKKNIRNTSAQQIGPTDCPETAVATNLRPVHPRTEKTSFTLRRKLDITHLHRCSQLVKSHETHQLQQ